VTYAVANITPPQAAANRRHHPDRAAVRLELGSAFIQTFVRVREQFHSNIIEQHLSAGSDVVERILGTDLPAMFSDHPVGRGDATAQASGRRSARGCSAKSYVLAYIDCFLGDRLGPHPRDPCCSCLLRPPPPNPLTPPLLPNR
jgi:DHA2 family multidrug resistance protein